MSITLTAFRGKTRGCPTEGRLGGVGWIDPTPERLGVAKSLLDSSGTLQHAGLSPASKSENNSGFQDLDSLSGWSKDPQITSFRCLTSPLSNAQQATNSRETRKPSPQIGP